MTNTFRAFRIALAAGLSTSTLAEAAVWDDYATLVCRGGEAVSCSIGEVGCSRRNTNAVWKIDFRKGAVTYLGGKLTEAILAKHVTMFETKPLGQRIFLDSGRILSFHKGSNDPATGFMIPATLVGDELVDGVEASTFQCSPNF